MGISLSFDSTCWLIKYFAELHNTDSIVTCILSHPSFSVIYLLCTIFTGPPDNDLSLSHLWEYSKDIHSSLHSIQSCYNNLLLWLCVKQYIVGIYNLLYYYYGVILNFLRQIFHRNWHVLLFCELDFCIDIPWIFWACTLYDPSPTIYPSLWQRIHLLWTLHLTIRRTRKQ